MQNFFDYITNNFAQKENISKMPTRNEPNTLGPISKTNLSGDSKMTQNFQQMMLDVYAPRLETLALQRKAAEEALERLRSQEQALTAQLVSHCGEAAVAKALREERVMTSIGL